MHQYDIKLQYDQILAQKPKIKIKKEKYANFRTENVSINLLSDN